MHGYEYWCLCHEHNEWKSETGLANAHPDSKNSFCGTAGSNVFMSCICQPNVTFVLHDIPEFTFSIVIIIIIIYIAWRPSLKGAKLIIAMELCKELSKTPPLPLWYHEMQVITLYFGLPMQCAGPAVAHAGPDDSVHPGLAIQVISYFNILCGENGVARNHATWSRVSLSEASWVFSPATAPFHLMQFLFLFSISPMPSSTFVMS